MSARDDFGSRAGTPGGYSGGAGGLGNGGVGGGMGGGLGGGGAGRNGGIGSRTGLTTGTSFSGDQTGAPGGIAGVLASLAKPRAAAPRPQRPPTMQPPLPPYVEPPPPTIAPPPAPPQYPVGTLAKAMWDNIFNQPATPPSGVTDDMVPGFGATYTPPAQVTLPSWSRKDQSRLAQDPNAGPNPFDPATGVVGRAKDQSRVPQDSNRKTTSGVVGGGDPYGKK